jgi:hypothetical protein
MNKYVLLNVHAVNDVREMEICVHTTEPQVKAYMVGEK